METQACSEKQQWEGEEEEEEEEKEGEEWLKGRYHDGEARGCEHGVNETSPL